ncbi:DeoR/GlpR family DNA-binding transcription regulator [Arcanobacterium phocae]|uniref:DeoR/GlpR family DNA-binding transcription regulator n=1 Tax=Arcanobacterium phocae TaxID=131112 RepID=UPI001C0ED706|nr:DeoR/GlpR family DNA-binding transcription regulator [Arcanobacterium phocae]
MRIDERRQLILKELHESGGLDVPALAFRHSVSESTIRRDLKLLDSQGMLQRVRGGAIDVDKHSFAQTEPTGADEKAQIGHYCSSLVPDNSVVLLDIGTTTAAIARSLYNRPLTVLTASLAVVDILRHSSTTELIILGGVLRRSYLSMVGSLTERALTGLRADIAFIGTSGVCEDHTVMDSTGTEVPIKRAILSHSRVSYLVAGSEKFPGSGVLPVCQVNEFSGMITTCSNSITQSIQNSGTQVMYA